MAVTELQPAQIFRHPDQPLLVYDIHKPWEQNVADGPIWRGGYPPYPAERPYRFLGHELISPITIAAGPASGKRWTDFYLTMGYGLVMEKTRRTVPRGSNPTPNVAIIKEEQQITRENLDKTLHGSMDEREYQRYRSVTNSFGNPSPNMFTWATHLREQRESVRSGQLLGCSITATALDSGPSCSVILGNSPETAVLVETASDMLIGGTAAAVSGAQVIEFNLACPNVTDHPEEGEMFQNPQLVRYLFAEWKRRFPNNPAGFKAGLYKDKDQMRRVLAGGGDNLGFVSLINAVAMKVVDGEGNKIIGGGTIEKAGTCGVPLQTIALEEIEWAADIRESEGLRYEIIGGGGIVSVWDVDRYRDAGADVVFSGSYVFANPLFAYEYYLSKH